MINKIFVNLPVKDLVRSKEFFSAIGLTFNPQFTDDNAACLVISENIFAMLITEPMFQTFTKKPISDAKAQTEVLLALHADSKEEVQTMVEKALAAGGRMYRDPEDHGWMYAQVFEDLDGHQWEIFFMDERAAPQKE